jgi:hypothetical protein
MLLWTKNKNKNTEMIKARRLKQLPEEGYSVDEIRPVKHVRRVMVDFIEKLQRELKP